MAATNCWVVSDDGRAILIDVPPESDEIGEYLADSNLAVSGILLTHGHIDHMGGAGEMGRRTGAVTYVHPDDDFLTLHPTEQLRNLLGIVPPGDFGPPEVMEGLKHGDVLDFGGINLEVRHTPGHTPGHCCFYWAREGILFSGDQLFAGSIGRTDLPGGSHQALLESMRDHVLTLDDAIEVLPGHGPVTTIGRERRSNPFLVGL